MSYKQCSNECGSSYCCDTWVQEYPYDEEIIRLMIMRGMDVRLHGHSVISIQRGVRCRLLSENGCSAGSLKPKMCENFPDPSTGGHFVLPGSCKYADMECVIPLESMPRISISLDGALIIHPLKGN